MKCRRDMPEGVENCIAGGSISGMKRGCDCSALVLRWWLRESRPGKACRKDNTSVLQDEFVAVQGGPEDGLQSGCTGVGGRFVLFCLSGIASLTFTEDE